MNLRGRKIKSRSYSHFLFNRSSAVSEDEMRSLVRDLLNGCLKARDKIILAHLTLTLTIVGRYLTVLGSRERWSEDLVSAAVLGLTKKVDSIREGAVQVDDFQITGKLVNAVHNAVSREYERSRLVRTPQRTQRARLKAGKALIPEPKVYESRLLEVKGHEYLNRYDSAPDDQVHLQGWWRYGSKLRRSTRHVKVDDNLKNAVCFDEFEKSVFELCENSPTPSNGQIANSLGVSRETVRKTRIRLGERLKKEFEL